MHAQRRSFEMDMTEGPLFKKILVFALPLVLANNLQILFNFADLAVVGRFAGSQALAAVGANTSLIALMTNLFIGISTGTDILVSRHRGELDDMAVSRAAHTAIAAATVIGVGLLAVGIIISRPVLTLMNTPEDSLELAILYLRIYFIGMPANMLYQFGSAILRAVGDTRRPLAYLSFAGALNVVLNLLFVIKFDMSVAGVAIATISSQTVSAILVIRCLITEKGAYRIEREKLRIDKRELSQILRLGVPIGLQSCLFSVSNVLCQASVNIFGSLAVAGCSAASSVENFCFNSMNAITQTTTSFSGQNYGAGKYDRILRVYLDCLLLSAFIGFAMGQVIYANGAFFIGLFDKNPEVVPYGLTRMSRVVAFAFLAAVMDISTGTLRAMGKPLPPMISTLVGVCGLRIVHIYTIFAAYKTLDVLFLSYPVSWGISGTVNVLLFIFYYRRLLKESRRSLQIVS